MAIYTITYYLVENSHSCGCEHNHDEDHECGCDHNHDENHECGCDHEHDHGRDDYEITAHIKTLGSWAHFMPTSFLVKTDKTANEMLEVLRPTVESGDMIFINKVDADDVASLSPAVVDWIRK